MAANPGKSVIPLNTAGGDTNSVEGSRGAADRTPMGPNSTITCHTQKTPGPAVETLGSPCSLLLYWQYLGHGTSLDICQLMNE